MSQPNATVECLTESPASEAPPITGSLETANNFNAQHKRELDDYRKIFNENMENKPVKHDQVHVLIWTWADAIDDLHVRVEVDRLEKVFKEEYAFEVERRELSSLEKASHQLNRFLSSFMADHDEPNTLLIFYYAGHGLYENNTVVFKGADSQQGDEEKQRNNVSWSSAEHNIRASSADVLVIFDCCHAGGFGGFGHRAPKKTPFQCIAACGPLGVTTEPGEASFTSALIWALEQLRPLHDFSSIALLEKIKEYPLLPKGQKPNLLRRDEENDALVWIAPQKRENEESVPTKSERRNPSHEYLDLRFNFYRRVGRRDAEMVAKSLSRLVHENRDFQAKHIVLLDKTSAHSKAIRSFTSGLNKKRKRSSPNVHQSSTDLVTDLVVPSYSTIPSDSVIETSRIIKRIRLADPNAEPAEPQNALYHFRMALHCSLQNVKSQIGRFADRIRPGQQIGGDLADINREDWNSRDREEAFRRTV